MLEVSHVLDRLNIRRTSVPFAVADVAVRVADSSDPLYAATKLFNDILSVTVPFKDAVHARIASKHMIRDVLTYKCKIDNDDVQDIVDEAIEYADGFCANPANSYLWSQPDEDKVSTEIAQTVIGCEQKVVLREDGKIKKGGKQVLAAELYDKHVKNAVEPISNTVFIQLLIDTLDMTKPGATTYAYNCRKAHKMELAA